MGSEIGSDFCEAIARGTVNLAGSPLYHREALFLPGE